MSDDKDTLGIPTGESQSTQVQNAHMFPGMSTLSNLRTTMSCRGENPLQDAPRKDFDNTPLGHKRPTAYSFCGRASRKEFCAYLCSALVVSAFVATLLLAFDDSAMVITLACSFGLATAFFFIAATVRRLHDIGFSGMLTIICMVPIVPAWGVNIVLLLLFLILLVAVPGEPRGNCYGENLRGQQLPPKTTLQFGVLRFYGKAAKVCGWLIWALGSIGAIAAYSWTIRSYSYWGGDSYPYRGATGYILIASLLWGAAYFVHGAYAFSQTSLAEKIANLKSQYQTQNRLSRWLKAGGWYFRILAILTFLISVYLPAILKSFIDTETAVVALCSFPFILLLAGLGEGIAESLFCQAWCEANCPVLGSDEASSPLPHLAKAEDEQKASSPFDSVMVAEETNTIAVVDVPHSDGDEPLSSISLGNSTPQMIAIPGKSFSISKYPVTQELWELVMGDNPSAFKGADRPVENVSWYDCQKFLEKLNALSEIVASGRPYRLPTEEEWKFACLAGSTVGICKLADGSEITKNSYSDVAWHSSNSGNETHPVGQKKPNAFGLYDMLGNVWEWTSTKRMGSYVDCGGSFGSPIIRANVCDSDAPDAKGGSLGFRLARDIA